MSRGRAKIRVCRRARRRRKKKKKKEKRTVVTRKPIESVALPRGAAVLITAIVSPNERASEVVFPVRRDTFIISVSYLWLPRNSLKMRSARTVKPTPNVVSRRRELPRLARPRSRHRSERSIRQHERGGKKTRKRRRKGRTRERTRRGRKRSRRIEGRMSRARAVLGKHLFRPEQRVARGELCVVNRPKC